MQIEVPGPMLFPTISTRMTVASATLSIVVFLVSTVVPASCFCSAIVVPVAFAAVVVGVSPALKNYLSGSPEASHSFLSVP